MKYQFEKRFNSDLYIAKQVVGEALLFLRGCVPYMREDQAADLRLVFDELLTNAVKHGNRFDKEKSVGLYIEVEEGRVFSKVTDEGPGFDYRSLVNKFNSGENLLSEHGRGVGLAYYMTDMIYFDANGSEVKFCKRLVNDE